jgi:hypothetical protein
VPTRMGSANFGLVSGNFGLGSANFDLVTPIKARALDALHVVLRSRTPQLRSDPRIMRKGAERC